MAEDKWILQQESIPEEWWKNDEENSERINEFRGNISKMKDNNRNTKYNHIFWSFCIDLLLII